MRVKTVLVSALGICILFVLLFYILLERLRQESCEVQKRKEDMSFMELCEANFVDDVRLALEKGASPHSPAGYDTNYYSGSTPLMVSVENNQDPEMAVIRLLLAAGADPNQENASGKAPLEVANDAKSIELLLKSGAWLVGRNTHGVLRARGIESETVFSETRFFQVTDPQFLSPPKDTAHDETAQADVDASQEGKKYLQQRLFAHVVANQQLEIASPADLANVLKFTSQIEYIEDTDPRQPVVDMLYLVDTKNGVFVLGRTYSDGTTVRVYATVEENIWFIDGDFDAHKAATAALQPETSRLPYAKPANAKTPSFYGERICFVDPKTSLPVLAYPYYILTDRGMGVFGKTRDRGCTEEIFVPAPSSPFRVFGGADALKMDVLGGG